MAHSQTFQMGLQTTALPLDSHAGAWEPENLSFTILSVT